MATRGGSESGAASTSAPSEAASTSSLAMEKKAKPSCATKFDAVYFCYSPVYQMSQYYRYGELDDCFGKWREFYDCITYGTNFHQEPDQPERKPCMWELKDFKTAQRDWDNVFNSK